MRYIYFGNFQALRPEVVIWRLRMLGEILEGRRVAINERVKLKLGTEQQASVLKKLLRKLTILVSVTAKDHKLAVEQAISKRPLNYKVEVFSIEDIDSKLRNLESSITKGKP